MTGCSFCTPYTTLAEGSTKSTTLCASGALAISEFDQGHQVSKVNWSQDAITAIPELIEKCIEIFEVTPRIRVSDLGRIGQSNVAHSEIETFLYLGLKDIQVRGLPVLAAALLHEFSHCYQVLEYSSWDRVQLTDSKSRELHADCIAGYAYGKLQGWKFHQLVPCDPPSLVGLPGSPATPGGVSVLQFTLKPGTEPKPHWPNLDRSDFSGKLGEFWYETELGNKVPLSTLTRSRDPRLTNFEFCTIKEEIDQSNFQQAISLWRDYGDGDAVLSNPHGTPEERYTAFLDGFLLCEAGYKISEAVEIAARKFKFEP
jgi:hypothetical protein